MHQLLQLFTLVPLAAFVVSLFIKRTNEKALSLLAICLTGLHFLGLFIFTGIWVIKGGISLDIKHMVLFSSGTVEIFLDLYFDKFTAVFALIGSLLAFLVMIFSRYYMHREEGFKRYFITMILFFFSYQLVIFSGNFETLFIGWEILGVCSFLLISFFRDRYLPVRNAMKVISIYRMGDVCLLLGMWMSHLLWHKNVTFSEFGDATMVAAHLSEHYWSALFIALMVLVAASAKSAQIPFSSWLPRVMEGPTSSSAIFYGSLSVHLGVFILLRASSYWGNMTIINGLIIGVGTITFFMAGGMSRVQSTVKTQIAYSSIAQIGLIFIEIGLGWYNLALIHFAANSFLRTYQLLVSPSVLSYLTHDMFFSFKNVVRKADFSFFGKLKNTLYMLSLKEWNLDFYLFRFLWSPFKFIGKKFSFLTSTASVFILFILYFSGLVIDLYQDKVPESLFDFLPFFYSIVGLLLVLSAFSERRDARIAWATVIGAQLFITCSVLLLNQDFGQSDLFIYLSGTIVCAILGFVCLNRIKRTDDNIRLDQFHGYVYDAPITGTVFLLACLGLVGLPFTPTFIGIDLLFNHIHKNQEILIACTSLSFIFIEIAVIRIYTRVFLGSAKRSNHPVAFRSS